MSSSFQTIAFVFALIGLGFVSAMTGLLRREAGDSLADFAVTIALPLLLFKTMASADFGHTVPWRIWLVYFTAAAFAWTAGQMIVARLFKRDARAGIVGGVTAAFSNLVLLGLPIILSLYGQQGFAAVSLVVAVHLPVMMSASIILFEWAGRDEAGMSPVRMVKTFLTRLVANPLIIGIVAGLAWRLTGWPMPALGERIVDALGGIGGTVALFAMGMSLRKFGISGNVGAGLAVEAIKLGVMPAVVLGLLLLAGMSGPAAQALLVAAAMPSGVNSYLIATRFGTGQALASNAMTIGTAAAIATTAFWVAIAHLYLQ